MSQPRFDKTVHQYRKIQGAAKAYLYPEPAPEPVVETVRETAPLLFKNPSGENTCYANAIVSILLEVRDFRDFLHESREHSAVCEELLQLYRDSRNGSVQDLKRLKFLVLKSDNIEWSFTSDQQDSVQFFSSLLETIENNIKDNEFLLDRFKAMVNVVNQPKYVCKTCRSFEHGNNEEEIRPLALSTANDCTTLKDCYVEEMQGDTGV